MFHGQGSARCAAVAGSAPAASGKPGGSRRAASPIGSNESDTHRSGYSTVVTSRVPLTAPATQVLASQGLQLAVTYTQRVSFTPPPCPKKLANASCSSVNEGSSLLNFVLPDLDVRVAAMHHERESRRSGPRRRSRPSAHPRRPAGSGWPFAPWASLPPEAGTLRGET